jgi:mono/diheme cytochrome c family protein
MQKTWNIAVGMAAAALFASVSAPAVALQITLPPDDAALEVSTLPGYQKALQNCTACHAAQYMQTQPAASQAWWTAEVLKMKKVYGAPVPEADMQAIAEYMYSVYGSGQMANKVNAPAPVAGGHAKK